MKLSSNNWLNDDSNWNIRLPEVYEAGHVEGAINIPFYLSVTPQGFLSFLALFLPFHSLFFFWCLFTYYIYLIFLLRESEESTVRGTNFCDMCKGRWIYYST
jgi:hypothetical protein